MQWDYEMMCHIAYELYIHDIGPEKLKEMPEEDLQRLHIEIDCTLTRLKNFIHWLQVKEKEIVKSRKIFGKRSFVELCKCHECSNGQARRWHRKAEARAAMERPYVFMEDRYNPPICAEGD